MSALPKPKEESVYCPLPEPILLPQPTASKRRYAPLISTCALSLLASTLLFLAIGSAEGISNTPNLIPLAKSPQVYKKVALHSAIAERLHGFVRVNGEIQNQTNHRLRNVEAIVEFLNAEGNPFHTESVLLAQSPIAAHNKEHFEAIVQDVPGATSFRIEFRNLLSKQLN